MTMPPGPPFDLRVRSGTGGDKCPGDWPSSSLAARLAWPATNGDSGRPSLAYSASPSMDLLLHHHHRIKKQKEKGKEKEMTRRRRWGSRSGGRTPGSATGVGGEDVAEAWRWRRRRQWAGVGGASLTRSTGGQTNSQPTPTRSLCEPNPPWPVSLEDPFLPGYTHFIMKPAPKNPFCPAPLAGVCGHFQMNTSSAICLFTLVASQLAF